VIEAVLPKRFDFADTLIHTNGAIVGMKTQTYYASFSCRRSRRVIKTGGTLHRCVVCGNRRVRRQIGAEVEDAIQRALALEGVSVDDNLGTARTILDYEDLIEVDGQVFNEPANEYWALVCLRDGLEFLHRQATGCDNLVRDRINPNGNAKVFVAGNAPFLSGIPQGLLTCAFHWYAITACQYVRTVGAIAYRQDNRRPLPLEYVRSVIPEVLAFRDKVAAHFAWGTQNKNDSEADRLASILPPLTFVNQRFCVGALHVTVKSGTGYSSSDPITQWSIAEIHDRLRKRYWRSETSAAHPHARRDDNPM